MGSTTLPRLLSPAAHRRHARRDRPAHPVATRDAPCHLPRRSLRRYRCRGTVSLRGRCAPAVGQWLSRRGRPTAHLLAHTLSATTRPQRPHRLPPALEPDPRSGMDLRFRLWPLHPDTPCLAYVLHLCCGTSLGALHRSAERLGAGRRPPTHCLTLRTL